MGRVNQEETEGEENCLTVTSEQQTAVRKKKRKSVETLTKFPAQFSQLNAGEKGLLGLLMCPLLLPQEFFPIPSAAFYDEVLSAPRPFC